MGPSKTAIVVYCAMLLSALTSGCGRSGRALLSQAPEDLLRCALAATDARAAVPELRIQYPQDGTLFPCDMAAPTFRWQVPVSVATGVTIVVEVTTPGDGSGTVVESGPTSWQPGRTVWQRIKEQSRETNALLRVFALTVSPPAVAASGTVRFRTSADPVGAPIMFRDVPLPFIYAVKNPDTIRWRLGDVSSEQEPPVVLEGLPVCGNCHSFDRAGKIMGMDVDYANDKGSYAITALEEKTVLSREKIITWSDYRRQDNENTFGLLSRVSPDGRYIASTVKDRSVFVPMPDLMYSQLFFPIKGIVAFYDRRTGEFAALPGAGDRRFVQTNPVWSPDGKWLYFCRAEAAIISETDDEKEVLLTAHLAEPFVKGTKQFKFGIFRVPFNGGKGGAAEPVPGASDNGESNYFPKISPDGKWLVFCRARNFMLLQPDSKLYIMPANGGVPRLMTCNGGGMNSWHSWSPNGKWLVFSSKERGPYTQLCITHVDEEGNDTPAVHLDRLQPQGRACNIPEFLNSDPGARLALREDFLDGLNFRRQGQLLLLSGDFAESIPLFRKALALDPGDYEAGLRLAFALLQSGKEQEAEERFNRLLRELGPGAENRERRYDVHCHLAMLCRGGQRLAEAISHYDKCLECKPDDVAARLRLGLAHASGRDLPAARRRLSEAVRLAPDNALARLWLGMVLHDGGAAEEAQPHLVRALSLLPEKQGDWLMIAQRVLPRRDLGDELDGFLLRCEKKYPDWAEVNVVRAKLRLQQGNAAGAVAELRAARRKDPSIPWIDAKIEELALRPPSD